MMEVSHLAKSAPTGSVDKCDWIVTSCCVLIYVSCQECPFPLISQIHTITNGRLSIESLHVNEGDDWLAYFCRCHRPVTKGGGLQPIWLRVFEYLAKAHDCNVRQNQFKVSEASLLLSPTIDGNEFITTLLTVMSRSPGRPSIFQQPSLLMLYSSSWTYKNIA